MHRTPASDAIFYEKEEGRFNLFRLNPADGKETQISDFNQQTDTGDFVWSKDGGKILFFRVSQINNIVLIKDVTSSEQQRRYEI